MYKTYLGQHQKKKKIWMPKRKECCKLSEKRKKKIITFNKFFCQMPNYLSDVS